MPPRVRRSSRPSVRVLFDLVFALVFAFVFALVFVFVLVLVLVLVLVFVGCLWLVRGYRMFHGVFHVFSYVSNALCRSSFVRALILLVGLCFI